MKIVFEKKAIVQLFSVVFCLTAAASWLSAQETTKGHLLPQYEAKKVEASIGQGTNLISIFQIKWIDSRGLKHGSIVCFARDSKEAIKSFSTNQICFLNGRLYAAGVGIQAFSIYTSKKVDLIDLTAEKAADFAINGIQGSKPSLEKQISLQFLLQSEKDKHLAQPLFMRTVRPVAMEGKLIVYFESYTGMKGKVVLDAELNLISSELT